MAGIYIHIPYCKQPCSYCNFHFSVNLRSKEAFINALLHEIELRKDYLSGEKAETLYLGGGTPSLLNADELQRIFEKLHTTFEISSDAEITLEANPDDLTEEKIKELRQTPVNRFSIGVQSFHDDDLQFLNRAHRARQAETSIRLVQDAGFENITIDLIYAIPERQPAAPSSIVNRHSSSDKWIDNLGKVKHFHIPHFSAYCLTIEPKTMLEKMLREEKAPGVNDADAARQFEMLMDFASENGYDHYEISNFARPGFYSQHNTSYWTGRKYLGLGPSAHSYDGISRQWNVASNTLYIQSLQRGQPHFDREILTETNRFNEYLLTTLRTKWGADRAYLKEHFGENRTAIFEMTASKFFDDNLLERENGKVRLTRSGKLIADRIICELFETE